MAQGHLDRLSAVDAGFLTQESPTAHMHIGGIALFEGPPPPLGEFLGHLRSRLPLVPRYRQKLAFPPLDTGRPLWVDDPSFNLEYHVRHTALPARGSERSLLDLAGRVFSQALDRTKPLWELWLVEGLEDGGFALLSKTHHALVDGVSGVDLLTVLFDLHASGSGPAPAPEPWVPQPEPSGASLAAAGLAGAARTAAQLAGGAAGAAAHPLDLLGRAREVAQGVGEVAWAALNAPPATPFNVAPGPHRRIRIVRAELDEMRAVKDAFGGTVNDVVLAVVTGALAHFLQARGERTDGVELRACVPVSVRTTEQRGALGNQLTQILAPLPVSIEDPERAGALHRRGDARPQGVAPGAGRQGDRGRPGLRAADDHGPGVPDDLLGPVLQRARHERPRARSSRSSCSAAGWRRCSRSRSWPATARSRSRSCPTTAA